MALPKLSKPDSRTLVFVLLTLAVSGTGAVLGAIFALGWQGATATTLLVDLLLLGWVVGKRDADLGRLMLFGLVAGFVELLTADPFAVDNGTLVYAPEGPFLVDSPLYMPFAWISVIAQMTYLAWWALDRWGLVKASAILAVVGAVNIPVYEVLAFYSKTWYYQNTPMIWHAPYYVILGELLIGAAMPLAASLVLGRRLALTPVLGVAMGLWMWIGAIVSYHLVG